jgi:folate-binding protein YgfZ
MSSSIPARRLPLVTPTVIAFRGPDALRYLNGQLTQDVRLVADAGHALPSCVTDAKGRLQFRVRLHRSTEGDWLVSSEQADPDALFARLSRYLIADDAEGFDVTGEWRMAHVTGDLPADLRFQAAASNRIGLPGWDVWIPATASGDSLDRLLALDEWPADEAETQRIAAGIPAWGAELTEGMLPPEAGLDRTDVSYAKGCYIGQEVISRIKSAGKVNRRLVRLVADAGAVLKAGDRLLDGDGQEAGEVTSVAPLGVNSDRLALGYLKRRAEGAKLQLATGEIVRIAD